MLRINRKIPRKGRPNSLYGDRNSVILILEGHPEAIEISLSNLKGNELTLSIEGPKSMNIKRKELITGNKGEKYEKDKINRRNKDAT